MQEEIKKGIIEVAELSAALRGVAIQLQRLNDNLEKQAAKEEGK